MALTVVYAGALWRAQPIWHDDVTLFSRCVQNFPDSPHYRVMFAKALVSRGDLEGAGRELLYASKLSPDDYRILAKFKWVYDRLYRRKRLNSEAGKELRAYHEKLFPRQRPDKQTPGSTPLPLDFE